MRALFLIAIVVVGYLVYKLHLKRLLAQGKPGQIKLALIALGLVFLALAVMGRAPAIFAIIGAAMTQVMRLAPLLIRFAPMLKRYLGTGAAATGAAGAQGGTGGAQSKVRTTTLLMTLDHATGRIDGTVLIGPHEGRQLSELDVPALKRLYDHCREADIDALRLLESYLARERASEWQASGHAGTDGGQQGAGTQTGGAMSHQEALDILGLEAGAQREAIIEAHRRLMTRLHPDKGGSTYLASRVNLAKDLLLKG